MSKLKLMFLRDKFKSSKHSRFQVIGKMEMQDWYSRLTRRLSSCSRECLNRALAKILIQNCNSYFLNTKDINCDDFTYWLYADPSARGFCYITGKEKTLEEVLTIGYEKYIRRIYDILLEEVIVPPEFKRSLSRPSECECI